MHCRLQAYLAIHTVVSLRDLEASLVELFLSERVPRIADLLPPDRDPLEIDLEGESGDSTRTGEGVCEFHDYGLGDLRTHPLLRTLFQVSPEQKVSVQDCLGHLVDFLAFPPQGGSMDVEHFERYLSTKYAVGMVGELGLYISHQGWADLLRTLKEAVRARQKQEAHLLECLLRDTSYHATDAETTHASPKRAFRVTLKMTEALKARGLDRWLTILAERCCAEEKKPSMARVRNAVQQAFLEALKERRSSVSVGNTRDVVGSKRGRDAGSLDTTSWASSDVLEGLVDAAAEYSFLHLGSSKQVHKRFEICEKTTTSQEDDEQLYVWLSSSTPLPAGAIDHKATLPTPLPQKGCSANVLFESRLTVGHQASSTDLMETIGFDRLGAVLTSFPPHPSLSAEAVGRYGEDLVNRFLSFSLPTIAEVEWVNAREESTAAYDVVVREPTRTTFVEVKTSRFLDKNVFELSWNEWQFALSVSCRGSQALHYHVYRVVGVGARLQDICIVVLKDIVALVQAGIVKLCLAT